MPLKEETWRMLRALNAGAAGDGGWDCCSHGRRRESSLFVHAVPWMLPDSVKHLEGTAIRLDGR